ncbi:MAG: tetratricopeptide repeat protein [Salinibacter sp.]|uniref:tetratricopeptide repeat protein n=1 Tax=Salinibacter sp. TaxID=2065818 RepID=UPI0035D4EED8
MRTQFVALAAGLLLLTGKVCVAHSQSHSPPDSAGEKASILDDSFVRTHGTKGLDLLYGMQFEKAKAVFDRIDDRYPEHPIGPFLKGLNLWWTIMLDLTDTSHDEAFIEQMNTVIARCNDLLNKNPDHFDAALFKAAAHGFLARLHSNRRHWWQTIRNAQKAINYVQKVEDVAPKQGDYVFGPGMYDYYSAILAEEYTLSKAILWLLPDGNEARGLRLLREAATNGRYVQTEAAYFLAKIHYLYEDSFTKSRKWVSWLRQEHPNNPFFHAFEGRVYARWGRWERAQAIFQTILKRCRAGNPGYNLHMKEVAHLYLARDQLYDDQYQQALSHLAQLEQLTSRDIENTRYRMLGYLYQGMVYDALGQRKMALSRYRKVLRMEDTAGAHKRARQYLDAPYSG